VTCRDWRARPSEPDGARTSKEAARGRDRARGVEYLGSTGLVMIPLAEQRPRPVHGRPEEAERHRTEFGLIGERRRATLRCAPKPQEDDREDDHDLAEKHAGW